MHDSALQDDNNKTINANTISNDSIATTMDKNHPKEEIQTSQKGDLETSTSETSSDSSTPTNYNETAATELTQGKQEL